MNELCSLSCCSSLGLSCSRNHVCGYHLIVCRIYLENQKTVYEGTSNCTSNLCDCRVRCCIQYCKSGEGLNCGCLWPRDCWSCSTFLFLDFYTLTFSDTDVVFVFLLKPGKYLAMTDRSFLAR